MNFFDGTGKLFLCIRELNKRFLVFFAKSPAFGHNGLPITQRPYLNYEPFHCKSEKLKSRRYARFDAEVLMNNLNSGDHLDTKTFFEL